MRRLQLTFVAFVLILHPASGCATDQKLGARIPSVDSRLPVYTPVDKLDGSIKSIGSDVLNNLITMWGEVFIEAYPQVQVEIEGKGTATGPPSLIAGYCNFATCTRPWRQSEIDAFVDIWGYKPTMLRVAVNQIAVFVHKDNPIAKKGLTLAQLDAIFSSTRKLGHPNDITTWGDLGLEGEWADKPIQLYGRNSASHTYGFFKHVVLQPAGKFKDSLQEQPGSSAIVGMAGKDKFGIGYSGAGYATESVAIVPIISEKGELHLPIAAHVDAYPLGQYLLIYVNYRPNTQIEPLRREFLKLIFSRQGQEQVVRDGYLPINADLAREELKKVGIPLQFDSN